MNSLLIVIHVIVCIFIILIVLLQVGRGAEAGAVFGGTGQVHSSRGKATFIGKLTTAMAITFMLTSLLLTYNTSTTAKTSVIDKVNQENVLPGPSEEGTTEKQPTTENQSPPSEKPTTENQ